MTNEDKTAQEQALDAVDYLQTNYDYTLRSEVTESKCETIRQALQSQAEKDRVMKLMVDDVRSAVRILNDNQSLSPLHSTHKRFEETLAEYAKLGVE